LSGLAMSSVAFSVPRQDVRQSGIKSWHTVQNIATNWCRQSMARTNPSHGPCWTTARHSWCLKRTVEMTLLRRQTGGMTLPSRGPAIERPTLLNTRLSRRVVTSYMPRFHAMGATCRGLNASAATAGTHEQPPYGTMVFKDVPVLHGSCGLP